MDSATVAMIAKGLLETLYMTVFSTSAAYLLGLPLGIILVVSAEGSILPRPVLNKILNILVNLTRSVPFLILLIAVLPITRFITGTTIGSTATVVPLIIAAAPFVARLVESSIKEVDKGIIEAALSMGATPFEIITKVMIPEAKPSLILGAPSPRQRFSAIPPWQVLSVEEDLGTLPYGTDITAIRTTS